MQTDAPVSITRWIERFGAIDAVSDPLQKAARRVIPEPSKLKDVLSGTWLGHPLHPLLTDVVIGSWTSALLLDLGGGKRCQDAADRLVGFGVLAAIPTASAGVSDWADLHGGTRRVGSVHAVGNVAAVMLHGLSMLARRRQKRGPGIALSALGYGVAAASAWLGGHLSYAQGVGVNQTAFQDAPGKWTATLAETTLEEGKMASAEANGVPILLVREGGKLFALADRCSHRGCALHDGALENGAVKCPCHGSTFRLDGSIVRGPATSPQPSFAVRVRAGMIEIRARPS